MAEGGPAADLTCPRCGAAHEIIACPYVKAIEFEDGDGKLIRRLEFLTPADYGPAPKPPAPETPPEPEYPKL